MKTDATPITGTSWTAFPGILRSPFLRLNVSQAQRGVEDGVLTRIQNVIPPFAKRGVCIKRRSRVYVRGEAGGSTR